MPKAGTCNNCLAKHYHSKIDKWFCYGCFVDFDGDMVYAPLTDTDSDGNHIRLNKCPLVEVKEPHGRLIDADALIKASGVTIQITGDKNARVVAEALESIYQDIEDAPTVIEGSE